MATTRWTRVSMMPPRDEPGAPLIRMPALRREDVYDPVSDITITVWSEIAGGSEAKPVEPQQE